MGNPNGDPDENRPRRLPDGTFYVTDVRLKRFVRDWLKTQGEAILVDRPEDSATNLTGRVQHFLASKPEPIREECERYEKLRDSSKETAKAEVAKEKKAKKGKKSGASSENAPEGGGTPAEDDPQPETTDGEGRDETPQKVSKANALKAEAGRLVVS